MNINNNYLHYRTNTTQISTNCHHYNIISTNIKIKYKNYKNKTKYIKTKPID